MDDGNSVNERDRLWDSFLGFLFGLMDALFFAFIFTSLMNSFVFRVYTVDGNSMDYTLADKDRLVVSNLLYEPEVGDVVAIKTPDFKFYKETMSIVKRVVAKAGQTVNISDEGDVYVDDVKLNEPYVHDKTIKYIDKSFGEVKYPVTVPRGYVFVLGDNRSVSCDSRAFGVVSNDRVLGRVVFRMFPLKSIGSIY